MNEQLTQPPTHEPLLREGQVLFGGLDAHDLENEVSEYAKSLEDRTGNGYVVQPAVVGDITPFESLEDGELQAFVVAEGRGAIEITYGNKERTSESVGPGSLVLVAGSKDLKKTPWMRASTGDGNGLKGYWIGSRETQGVLAREAAQQFSAGSSARKRESKKFEKVAAKKAKNLGQFTLRSYQ